MKTDYNSSENQRIKDKLVNREVMQCQSSLVVDILSLGMDESYLTIDDIENLYQNVCTECGKTEEDCNCRNNAYESEPQEILEWWLVNKWFYEKLKEKGEAVLTDDQSYWWGRCCSGQAISLDHVINEIAEDMEILDGMKHNWSKVC